MSITTGKRVSAREAAVILGVPYANISRVGGENGRSP